MESSLTIIGGFVLRLLNKSGELDEQKEKKYLGITKSESGKLELLVNDFLQFSRLETARLKLNFSATPLDKELIGLSDSYQLKASPSGLCLELKNDEQPPVIMGDTSKLRRVFTHFLDNAFKFSKEKGTITLSTHETADDRQPLS